MSLRKSLRRLFGDSTRDAFAAQRRLVTTPTPTIFDVGAHVGETARRYRAAYPEAAIHCFEPFPGSFAELRAALAADAQAHLHPLALGATAGRAMLNVNRSKATNSLLASDSRAASYWGHAVLDTDTTVEVRLATLDGFCAEQAIAHVDILKLDVQGGEFDVLTGAQRLLAAHAIDLVYLEMITAPTYVGQHELHEYLALFRAHDYVLFDYYNPVRRNGRLLQTDNLMVAESYLAAHERV